MVTDSNVVQTMQYFSGDTNIGIVTNTSGVLLTNSAPGNPFFLSWSNVLAGNYTLTAVATDSAGNTATSAPVNIIVTNPPPRAICRQFIAIRPTARHFSRRPPSAFMPGDRLKRGGDGAVFLRHEQHRRGDQYQRRVATNISSGNPFR